MSTIRRIAKNTLIRTMAEFLNVILSAIFLIYVARYLGSANFGKYSFAFSFAGLFIILTDMGLHTLLIREIVKEKGRAGRLFGNVLIVKSVLSAVVFLFILFLINLMNYPPDTTRVVYIMGAFVMATSFLDLFNSIFRAFERMEFEALIMFSNRLIVVLSGLGTLYLGLGLESFVLAIFIGNVVSIIPSFLLITKKFVIPRIEIDFSLWKSFLKEAFPIGLMMVFTAIYLKIDSVILSILKGDSAVGWYSAPHRLIESLIIFPTFFLAAVFPVFVNLYQNSKEMLTRMYEGSLRFMITVGLPLAMGTTFLADKIMVFIFGREYINSIIVLQILIWAGLLMSINILFNHLLIAINRQGLNVITSGVSAFGNLTLNLLLIPQFSYIGAGLALLLSQILLFLLNYYFICTYLYKMPIFKVTIKPLISMGLVGGLIILAKELNFLLLVILSIAIYIAILFLLQTFTREDILMLKEVVRMK